MEYLEIPLLANLKFIILFAFFCWADHFSHCDISLLVKTDWIVRTRSNQNYCNWRQVRASIIEKRMRRELIRFGFDLIGFIPIPGDNVKRVFK